MEYIPGKGITRFGRVPTANPDGSTESATLTVPTMAAIDWSGPHFCGVTVVPVPVVVYVPHSTTSVPAAVAALITSSANTINGVVADDGISIAVLAVAATKVTDPVGMTN
jgi:hypothetical protein